MMLSGYALIFCMLIHGLINAYTKNCYVKPRYARKDTLTGVHDKKPHLMQHHLNKDLHKHRYNVPSGKGRGECYINLNEKDIKRLIVVLKNYDNSSPVTDAMIEFLLRSKSNREEITGCVLRDFKKKKHNITIGEIKQILGL